MIPPDFILFEFEKRIKEIDERWLIDRLIEILIDYRYELEDKNREQLREGKKSDGSLFKEYAPLSVFLKGNNFDFRGHYRLQLFDTGSFHSELFLDIQDDKIFFWSRDSKTSELVGKYGDNIFGLTEKNVNLVMPKIEDKLINRVAIHLIQHTR